MWSKEIVELLISQYKEHENLYDMSHPHYVDRVKRSISIFAICKELKKLNPRINEEDVKKKIHTLRSQYLKELREMDSLRKDGFCEKDVYSPKLWCFAQLEFLESHCSIKKMEKRISRPPEDTVKIIPKRQKFLEEKEEMENCVVDAFEESGNDLSVLAQGWSSQYGELTKSQKIYARKLISSVLFHGSLENLQESTVREINKIFDTAASKRYDPLQEDE